MLKLLVTPAISQSAEPETLTIDTLNGGIELTVVRSQRARRMSLKSRPQKGDIALVIPQNVSFARAEAFAQSKKGWLSTVQAKLPKAIPLKHGEIIPVRGVEHEIVSIPDSRGTVNSWPKGEGDAYAVLQVPGGQQHLARRLKDWLKAEARKDISVAVDIYARRAGVKITGITIRDTSSRWGSCSHTGRLNFSWRLIMAPPFVLNYLAAHEVAHRREMNHSERFWAVVADIEPDFERAEDWLKRHGARLHRIGG